MHSQTQRIQRRIVVISTHSFVLDKYFEFISNWGVYLLSEDPEIEVEETKMQVLLFNTDCQYKHTKIKEKKTNGQI